MTAQGSPRNGHAPAPSCSKVTLYNPDSPEVELVTVGGWETLPLGGSVIVGGDEFVVLVGGGTDGVVSRVKLVAPTTMSRTMTMC